MPEREYNKYLEAIAAFVNGPGVRPYIAETFAEDFIRNFARDAPANQGRLPT